MRPGITRTIESGEIPLAAGRRGAGAGMVTVCCVNCGRGAGGAPIGPVRVCGTPGGARPTGGVTGSEARPPPGNNS
ncbi:hypothetical protein [Nonomuraea sp. NPDC048916]|uniref:hypothetical protein n=1 Tax=Nonomuraea sp. NPDC048916 TaxID=3154232 RepID=UPI0033CDAACA